MKRAGRTWERETEKGKFELEAIGARVALCHDFVQQVPGDVEEGDRSRSFLSSFSCTSERVGSAW